MRCNQLASIDSTVPLKHYYSFKEMGDKWKLQTESQHLKFKNDGIELMGDTTSLEKGVARAPKLY
jgi:hypothetical protein